MLMSGQAFAHDQRVRSESAFIVGIPVRRYLCKSAFGTRVFPEAWFINTKRK
jgi:hypothetical protein